MTEREFERKMDKLYPKDKSLRMFKRNFEIGYRSNFGNGMSNEQVTQMEEDIVLIN